MRAYTLTNRLFDEVFTNWDRAFIDGDHSYWRRNNSVESKTLEDAYEYYVPLAGFNKEDIKASVLDGEVYILAKNEDLSTASYSFLLPDDADAGKLSAENNNGLLTIRVEKLEKAKKIEIKIN